MMPASLRGVLWMTAASFFYACLYVLIRRLTESVPIFELVFLRAALGVALMLPWLMGAGLGALRTTQWRAYGVRAVIVTAGMVCWFYGLARLPVSDATALLFTLPLFTVLLAGPVLGETVGVHRWAATGVGFVGALIIIRPGVVEVSLAAGAVLFTALTYAAGQILTKRLTRTESSNALVFYMFALMAVATAPPAAYVWRTPAWVDVPWILALGILSAIAQQCITRSFAAAPASVVGPFNFLKLPFVAVIAFVWFAELPDPWTWLGGAVIFASAYYIARRESRTARQGTAAEAT